MMVHTSDFTDLLRALGIKEKQAHKFCAISQRQFSRWKVKGKMPSENFWAFQKELTVYFLKDMIGKMVKLGIIDQDFIKSLVRGEDE
jgi:hypothetical protein